MMSNEWYGHKSQRIRTEKMHLGAIKTSEELNSVPHPLFSMGAKRHYPARYCPDWKYTGERRHVTPIDHVNDKPHVGMKKIVENYVIVKPKVERIGGRDDFEELIRGKAKLQKY